MKSTRVKGLVEVVDYPVENHYHDGKLYYSVEVRSERASAKVNKTDYLRLYINSTQATLLTPGAIIKYIGTLVKSKITESLSDIAVAVDSLEVMPVVIQPALESVLEIEGRIIKINNEVINNNVKSVSILVANEADDGRRVIAKLTGIGRIADIITTFNLGDIVDVVANIYSYQVKNKDLAENYYLHDSRIISIDLL